jgi:hypothetical protein
MRQIKDKILNKEKGKPPSDVSGFSFSLFSLFIFT